MYGLLVVNAIYILKLNGLILLDRSNEALLLLIEKCPIDKLQRNQCTNFFIVRDIKMIVKWIIVFFILTYVASFLF